MLFICFFIRVIYIEVIEEFSLLLFINVFCRFIVLRGSLKEICLDWGINFVGFVDYLDMNFINVEEGLVYNFLEEK